MLPIISIDEQSSVVDAPAVGRRSSVPWGKCTGLIEVMRKVYVDAKNKCRYRAEAF